MEVCTLLSALLVTYWFELEHACVNREYRIITFCRHWLFVGVQEKTGDLGYVFKQSGSKWIKVWKKKKKKDGGGRGSESAGYVWSLAGDLLHDAEYGVYVSCLLAHAGHRLHWYAPLLLNARSRTHTSCEVPPYPTHDTYSFIYLFVCLFSDCNIYSFYLEDNVSIVKSNQIKSNHIYYILAAMRLN